jgi:hypothetical protein
LLTLYTTKIIKKEVRKMRRKEIIKIGNEEFVLQKDELRYTDVVRKDYKDIHQCYKKCSSRKYAILTHYYNLLDNNSLQVIKYGIKSYNANIITIHAVIDIDYQEYYVYITPTKNLIWRVWSDI